MVKWNKDSGDPNPLATIHAEAWLMAILALYMDEPKRREEIRDMAQKALVLLAEERGLTDELRSHAMWQMEDCMKKAEKLNEGTLQ